MKSLTFALCLVLLSCVRGSGVEENSCVTLDAAVRWNGLLYLFSGSQYLEVGIRGSNSSYVGNLTDWGDLPSNVDATVQYAGNYKHYFFKGDEYYSYFLGFLNGPWNSSVYWNSFFEGGIDAAASLHDESYFFKGCEYITVYTYWGSHYYSIPHKMPEEVPCDIDAAWDLETYWESMALAKGNQIYIWTYESITGPYNLTDYFDTQPWTICSGDGY